jgi:membrane protease YdiL (CAAX protease family)
MSYVLALVLTLFLKNGTNPNQELIISNTKLNPNQAIAVGVLLAPIVEEALFRGAVFGSIRRKNRILAYIVSAALFGVYHLWQYLLVGFQWELLLYMVQYVPGAIALAWCYERSGNIWSSILLHMVINFISLKVSIGF